MAAQFGEDHRHLRIAHEGGQLFLDVLGYFLRGAATGGNIAHQRHRDHAVRADRHGDAEFRIAPHRDLDDVVDADVVGVRGHRGGGHRRRRVAARGGGARGEQ